MNRNTRGQWAYVCTAFISIQQSSKLLLLDRSVETRVERSEHSGNEEIVQWCKGTLSYT
jgi:hypothetical protein